MPKVSLVISFISFLLLSHSFFSQSKIKTLTADISKLPKEAKYNGALKEVVKCNSCKNAFRIIEAELKFYRRFLIPLPHICFNCRHIERRKKINHLKLWHRKCMNNGCKNEFETCYAPERPEKVYCEKCYQNEVY